MDLLVSTLDSSVNNSMSNRLRNYWVNSLVTNLASTETVVVLVNLANLDDQVTTPVNIQKHLTVQTVKNLDLQESFHLLEKCKEFRIYYKSSRISLRLVNKPGLFGDHATCCGVPDINQGVLDGLNVDGVEPAPKNIPVPLIKSGPIVLCISMPYLHFSASSKRSKQPVNFKLIFYQNSVKINSDISHLYPFWAIGP